MWLKAKNIHSNRPSKKLDQKRYRLFRISKNICQEVFQLELLEGWMIHNVFNEDLLIQCRESQFIGQHIELAPPPDIINKEEEYCQTYKVWTQIFLIFFLFYFSSFLFFQFLGTGVRGECDCYVTLSHVTCHVIAMKGYRRFWKDNVIWHV